MGIGVDVIDISRVEKTIKENGIDYLKAVYTPMEIHEASTHRNPMAYYATRFAAKEAVAKCLEIPEDDRAEWTQIAIMKTPSGGLIAKLSGHLAETIKIPRNTVIVVSISWDGDYAIAVAQLQHKRFCLAK